MSIKVGVLRGGPSSEHEISLKTGEAVLSGLSHSYSGHDILLTSKGEWFFNGQFSHPEKIFRSVDVVFNALHGHYGEDGKVQQILELFKMPYTGSGILASAIGMNKVLAREVFARAELNVPRAFIINKGENFIEKAREVFGTINLPWVVKPASSGSSVGITIAYSFHDLISAIEEALNLDSTILIEEFIKGREATCGIIDNFRNKENYALPVVEIITSQEHDFFNYKAKYNGDTQEICPANFDTEIKKTIEEMAQKAHSVLGCRHYSRADFMISDKKDKDGKNKIYILEINTLPGLTKDSLLPKALTAVGSSYSEFLDHLLQLAISRK